MTEGSHSRRSSEDPRASEIAPLIAEDSFGARLELASRNMSREHGVLIKPASPPAHDPKADQTWLAAPGVEVTHCHKGHRCYMYPQGIASPPGL